MNKPPAAPAAADPAGATVPAEGLAAPAISGLAAISDLAGPDAPPASPAAQAAMEPPAAQAAMEPPAAQAAMEPPAAQAANASLFAQVAMGPLAAPAADGISSKPKRKGKPLTEAQRQRRNAQRRAKTAAERAERKRNPPVRHYTLRQQNFIEAYLRCGTIAQAACEAGYRTARGRYGTLTPFLRRPDVAAIIAARQAEMRRRSEVTMERVIGELAKLAFADPRDLFTPDGKLKPVHELDDASAASIAALEVLAVAGGRRSAARPGGRSPAGKPSSGKASGEAAPRGRSALQSRLMAVAAGDATAAPPDDAQAGNAQAGNAQGGDGDAAAEGGDMVLELRKIKRWDKTKALELLGRYLGLFKDRVELGVSSDLAAAIEAARTRSRALAAPDACTAAEARVIGGEVIGCDVIEGTNTGEIVADAGEDAAAD